MTSRQRDARLWLLRALLIIAVAVMHHVDTETPDAAGAVQCCVAEHHDGGSEHGSGSLHLCLAVLVGLAVLVIAWWSGNPVAAVVRGLPLPRPPPPVRLVGRRTLHTLCVLRL